MKVAEIHEMTNEELVRAIEDNRRELFNLRMQNQIGQVEDNSRIRRTRRDIARMLTEQAQRSRSAV